MKLHLPLLLLTALLATAPAKAEYYRAFMITDHPNDSVAYILSSSKIMPLPKDALIYRPGTVLDAGDAAGELPWILGVTVGKGFQLNAAAIFTTGRYGIKMDSVALTASLGSILLDDVFLSNSTLTTMCDDTATPEWGLPQVAIQTVTFRKGFTSVHSNFCTIRQWIAQGSHVFYLNEAAGSFTKGHADGKIEIHSHKGVNVSGLNMYQGDLTILDSGDSKNGDWDVCLDEIFLNDNVTVTANSGRGRIHVGSVVSISSTSVYSFTAKNVDISSNECGRLLVNASENVKLNAGAIKVADELDIGGFDDKLPDITLDGSLTVGNLISLQGKDIIGTASGAVISSGRYHIDAAGKVDILGTFQGGDLNLTADGPVTLAALGSSEKKINRAEITCSSAAPVTVKSFQGKELKIDAYGIVTIGRQKGIGEGPGILSYTGDVTINYLGEGGGEAIWDVDVLGEVKGSLTVTAEKGKVNAGHITGSGDITAKQIHVASFGGGNLDLKAGESVTVDGNIEASGRLAIAQLDGTEADVYFKSVEKIAANEISIQAKNITCVSRNLNITAENYLLQALDTISIAGTLQGGILSASAGGSILLDTVEVTGTAEKKSTITAGTKVAIGESAILAYTNVKAPTVSVENELILENQSSIEVEGSVTASNASAKITLENSKIAGSVENFTEVAMKDSIISGSVGKFSTLKAQGASLITDDLVLDEWAELSFVLDRENLSTPDLYIEGKMTVADPDAPALTINLTSTTDLAAAERYALITMKSGAAPDFWSKANVEVTGLTFDSGDLSWEGGTLYFTIGGNDSETPTWNGSEGHMQWDKEDFNWKLGVEPYRYRDGVTVVFNDLGAAGDVELVDELSPKSVLVNNSKGHDYTFTGEGKMTGAAELTKEGEGALTVNTANTHSGGTVLKGGTLVLGNNSALGSGPVALEGGTLDLGRCVIDNSVAITGDATLGNGRLNGSLSVRDGMKLTLLENTDLAATIALGEGAALDLGNNTISSGITMAGNASIGKGMLDADLLVGEGSTLTLLNYLAGSGTITLGKGAALDLGSQTLAINKVLLKGDATIGNGLLVTNLPVGGGSTLTLLNFMDGPGTISLEDCATLELDSFLIMNEITVSRRATISNGYLSGSVSVNEAGELTLKGNVKGSGAISLNTESTLRLTDGASVDNKVSGDSSATIVQTENGTGTLTGDPSEFTGNVEVESNGSLNLMNADRLDVADVSLAGTLGVYTGTTAAEASEGTLTVSGTLTAQNANSLLNANLVMKAGSTLDVSATGGNGGLHMGSTVTLDPGNVLLSAADMDAVNGLRYMQAYDLFSGVDGLSLDNGVNFLVELGLTDPWVKAKEVFANDLFKNAEKEYYLFYSGINQGGAGGNVGTVYLMQVPEPATGTLSLLALAALSARRRRK